MVLLLGGMHRAVVEFSVKPKRQVMHSVIPVPEQLAQLLSHLKHFCVTGSIE